MATKITMPQLGESVSEGTIGHWLKREGEMVKKDESLVEIVTDKVTAELPSPVSGRLAKILVAEDQTVKVGAEIGEIDEAGGNGSSAPSPGASASATTGATGSGATATNGGYGAVPQGSPNGGATAPRAMAAAAVGGDRAERATERSLEKVSPLARRLAQDHAVDLNAIQGTGEGGRVRKEDILAYVAQRAPGQAAASVATVPRPTAPTASSVPMPSAPPVTPTPAAPPVSAPPLAGDELITPTPARRAIAEHMVRSKHTSPHAWTSVEVDMTSLSRWLARHKDEFRRREGYGISYQTFAIKAAVEALREHPALNASWTEDGKILLRKGIHIGISIALDNNLIVPVIRDADTLSLAGIARAMSDLVGRARARRLLPADVQGGTFTVNNPGVFGTLLSMAIINQPNAGILTMDAVVKRPIVVDDAIAIRDMMYLSLSFDHRILDGLTAAAFLGAIKRRLEGWGPEIAV